MLGVCYDCKHSGGDSSVVLGSYNENSVSTSCVIGYNLYNTASLSVLVGNNITNSGISTNCIGTGNNQDRSSVMKLMTYNTTTKQVKYANKAWLNDINSNTSSILLFFLLRNI